MDKEKTLRKLQQELDDVKKKFGVEFAEVVRCKDCKWSRLVDDREPKYCCVHISRYNCKQWLDSNDFCSYGEWRDDNGN